MLGLALRAPSAPAQDAQAPRVLSVDIEGLRTVAKETCLARLQTRAGSPYLDTVVSEDIRRLFALGYFTDVRVETNELPEGLRVIFHVKEKSSLAGIEVQGARLFRSPRVLQLLGMKAGELYDPRRVKEGVEQLKAEYRRKGYARAEVASSITTNDAANTVTLYVVIDEGPAMRITQIVVKGNLAFSDARIRKVVKTKRRWWWFSGAYQEPVVKEDEERIRAFYRKNGYQDVEVTSEVAAAPSGEGLYVIFTLTEGRQHRIGTIAITGTVLFPERELRQALTLKPGAVYNEEALQDNLRALKQYYGDRGYIKAEVIPETRVDEGTKRVDVTFRMVEHELIYVDRVEVKGNLHTKDVVVRRELRVHPGEPFNGKSIRRSIERLYNLGYFEEVNVDTTPTSVANREDLVVDVKEAKTGSFSFGGGFSSVDRLLGMVELEQRNFDWRNAPTFVGAGEDVRLRAEVGTVRRNVELSFTEPWVFGQPISLGFDGYSRTRLRSRSLGLGFEERTIGGGLRASKELTDTVRVDWNYQLFRTRISDVADEASADLKAEQGNSTVSTTGLALHWDTRDNRFDPSKGAFAFVSGDLAGGLLSGSKDFYRLQAGASAYLPHGERFVLESRAQTGIVNAYGGSSKVPIFERFFGGGANTVRGFRERRVGPHDPTSNDPIGGEATFTGTLEEVMTLITDERRKPIIKGSIFLDVGDVWPEVGDYGRSLKSGAGIGTRITTPIGPIRLDVGFPLSRLEGEKRRLRLHFNVSRSF